MRNTEHRNGFSQVSTKYRRRTGQLGVGYLHFNSVHAGRADRGVEQGVLWPGGIAPVRYGSSRTEREQRRFYNVSPPIYATRWQRNDSLPRGWSTGSVRPVGDDGLADKYRIRAQFDAGAQTGKQVANQSFFKLMCTGSARRRTDLSAIVR